MYNTTSIFSPNSKKFGMLCVALWMWYVYVCACVCVCVCVCVWWGGLYTQALIGGFKYSLVSMHQSNRRDSHSPQFSIPMENSPNYWSYNSREEWYKRLFTYTEILCLPHKFSSTQQLSWNCGRGKKNPYAFFFTGFLFCFSSYHLWHCYWPRLLQLHSSGELTHSLDIRKFPLKKKRTVQ